MPVTHDLPEARGDTLMVQPSDRETFPPTPRETPSDGAPGSSQSDWKELHGHTARGSTNIGGWGTVVVGIPFAAIGTFAILIAADVVPSDEYQIHVPHWVLGCFGSIFVFTGCFMIVTGWLAARRRSRLKRASQRHNTDSWIADYAWDQSKISSSERRSLIHMCSGIVFVGVFLVPFNWWAFQANQHELLLIAVVGVFDVLLVGMIYKSAYMLTRHFKYGVSQLNFTTFPFFLGETLTADFSNSVGIGACQTITIELRCIQERYEVRGRDDSQSVVCYKTYDDTQTIDGPGTYRSGDAPLRFSFPLPDDAQETDLATRPPRYWELEIVAETAGIDFKAIFLVPVYRRCSTTTPARR